ncbi:DUF5724 domain-containing protein [Jiangella sp. DSM 45060]|uniref:DUF5724 domain-containing protein n=1 Tax=Jiangella sp. DSM 45060 TaxID=1798224 RepID=UPI00087969F8|nr:DUF5724 domain-containing protein [Jiangella sp. DSM 45060]SDT56538.1 HEAT repeat [Jiangella sp. DSM 45060]
MVLAKEQAQEQLQRFRSGRRGPRQLVHQVFASELARDLVGWLDDRGSGDPLALAARLDELDVRRLAKTFAHVAPALAEPLAHWWSWATRAPYQRHWQRRGFRSSHPQDTQQARMDHLGQLLRFGLIWPQDVPWFAAWSLHLRMTVPVAGSGLGGLFAAEIARGRTDVADVLTSCAYGRHPVGGITAEGIQGLLGSGRSSDSEAVVTLLRGAGRQEGVRSAVLEAADLAHPAAFRLLLDTVVAEDLTRFAGTVRAVGVWFGEELDVRSGARLGPVLAELSGRLGGALPPPQTPDQVFLALWAAGLIDAHAAVAQARPYLGSDDPQLRQAAARVLAELGLPVARAALAPLLADPDPAVYATAVSAWSADPFSGESVADLGPASAQVLLERVRTLGKAHKVETGRVGNRPVEIGSARAADVVLTNLGAAAAPPEAIREASADSRWRAALVLGRNPEANRSALFAFLTDASSQVRFKAFDVLRTTPLRSEDEARALEDALRRKAADLRRIALTLLRHQPGDGVRASVERLGAGTAEQQRAAAELAKAAGLPAPAAALGGGSPAASASAAPDDAVDEIPADLRFRPADRTPAIRPDAAPAGHFDRYHAGCRHVLTSLQAWLAEHADTEVHTHRGVELLRNVRWLPATSGGEVPLPELVGPWWERVSPTLAGGGVELVLLGLAVPREGVGWRRDAEPGRHDRWSRRARARIAGPLPVSNRDDALLWQLVDRLGHAMWQLSWTDAILDAVAELCHDLPADELLGVPEVMARRGRRLAVNQYGYINAGDARSAVVHAVRSLPLRSLTQAQLIRVWHLSRFLDEPEGTVDAFDGPWVRVQPPGRHHRSADAPDHVLDQPIRTPAWPELLSRAAGAGAATRGDLLDALLHVDLLRAWQLNAWFGGYPDAVSELSVRRPPEWAATPLVQNVVDEMRSAAITAELRRGDLPGPLSHVATRLRSATGAASLARVLAALGRRPLTRGYAWTGNRESSLSHLARIHLPGAGETVADLRAAFDGAGIAPSRVVEYGVYAPQWAALIEEYLDWPGFESAVWWVHAHTKDDSWSVDQQIREEWASAVSQRTPLDATDLVRGAADVAWFRDVIAQLGEERFGTVLKAAKYASSAGGHKRAELFARALLGQVAEAELLERIEGKRHQDSVRALGLLPLTDRDDPALLTRYETLRGFVRTDRTSGSQRRASETTAVTVGLENLARTAGYRDPQRLIWAMEAAAVRDLAAGPVVARDGDVTVSLTIDNGGSPLLTVDRAGRTLKAVPAAAAKVPEIKALKERATVLRQQAGRMRRSLEQACVDGDLFEPAEFDELLRHPVLAPLLRDLVVVTEEGVLGFAGAGARELVGPNGVARPADGSRLRVAHPVDLLESGEWADFQHAVFTERRRQPFRQLFRELYLPTAHEYDDGPVSRRYAGHQVEARRAAGLFTSRG